MLVPVAWVTPIMAAFMLKATPRFCGNICYHPSDVFFRDVPSYFSGRMPSHILHLLKQFRSKSTGTRLAWPPSRPVSHWKCVAHYEMQSYIYTTQTSDCWGLCLSEYLQRPNFTGFFLNNVSALLELGFTKPAFKGWWFILFGTSTVHNNLCYKTDQWVGNKKFGNSSILERMHLHVICLRC